MRVLITGGMGFVGSHLCRRYLDKGAQVVCLDNLSTGSYSNIEEIIDNPRFSILEHDIVDPLDLSGLDVICNFACPASPPQYQVDPVKTLKTSVIGSLNILELAKKNKARILQASTSEVYGDPLEHPQPETYWGHVNPIGIRSCYDEGKRAAETLFFDFWRQFKVDIRVIRIFNTYGPNMHPEDGRVVSNFIVQALRNQDLTVYGNGDQTRSFQYIDDLVGGIVSILEHPEVIRCPVNMGNPLEFTVLQLAEMVLSLIPKTDSKIVFQPLPSDDPRRRKPDISLAQKILNWQPTVALEDGLRKTISYFERCERR